MRRYVIGLAPGMVLGLLTMRAFWHFGSTWTADVYGALVMVSLLVTVPLLGLAGSVWLLGRVYRTVRLERALVVGEHRA